MAFATKITEHDQSGHIPQWVKIKDNDGGEWTYRHTSRESADTDAHANFDQFNRRMDLIPVDGSRRFGHQEPGLPQEMIVQVILAAVGTAASLGVIGGFGLPSKYLVYER